MAAQDTKAVTQGMAAGALPTFGSTALRWTTGSWYPEAAQGRAADKAVIPEAALAEREAA
jgi:hypothetical protein